MNQSEDFPSSLLQDQRTEPQGRAWDALVDCATLAFFDLEMSGLDPTCNHIIEVAVVRERAGNIVEEFASSISEANQDDLESTRPKDGAPTFASIAPRLHAMFRDAVPVAHGTELDLRFLHRAFSTVGLDPSVVAWALDTVVLARRAIASRSYTLAALTSSLELPSREWHHARDDALGVRSLFHRITPAFGLTTPRDLWQVRIGQRGPVVVRDIIACALERSLRSHEPCSLVLRARGKAESRVIGIVERWREPHAWIALAGGGVRVVRADRVLRVEPAG